MFVTDHHPTDIVLDFHIRVRTGNMRDFSDTVADFVRIADLKQPISGRPRLVVNIVLSLGVDLGSLRGVGACRRVLAPATRLMPAARLLLRVILPLKSPLLARIGPEVLKKLRQHGDPLWMEPKILDNRRLRGNNSVFLVWFAGRLSVRRIKDTKLITSLAIKFR